MYMIRKRILLVIDEIAMCQLLRDILQDEFHCIVSILYDTNNYYSALFEFCPDLIIATSYVHLPLVTQISQNELFSSIPIISISKSLSYKQAIEAGAVDFIPGPIDVNVLCEKVNYQLVHSPK